jgi:hypothetical protein
VEAMTPAIFPSLSKHKKDSMDIIACRCSGPEGQACIDTQIQLWRKTFHCKRHKHTAAAAVAAPRGEA